MAIEFVSADAQQLLSTIREATGPKFRDMSPADARMAYRQMSRDLDTAADEICAVRDIDIPLPDRALGARLYGEALRTDALTLYFHGGGWVAGDLETHDAFCRDLAIGIGGRVLAVDYRLAPEYRFPAAHDDCLAVARLALAGGLPFEHPVRKIGFAGDSAGANLAAWTALALAAETDSNDICGQLLLYPVVDLCEQSPSYATYAEDMLLERADMEYFIDSYTPNPKDRSEVSLTSLRNLRESPPTVLVTCSLDPLRDEGRAFAASLALAGIRLAFSELHGIPHGAVTLRRALPSSLSSLHRAVADYARLLPESTEGSQDSPLST